MRIGLLRASLYRKAGKGSSMVGETSPYHSLTRILQDGDVGIVVFPGANTIRDIPMMMSAATPHSSPGWIRLRDACTAISAAWTKLDHAVKAMRLRFADGSR